MRAKNISSKSIEFPNEWQIKKLNEVTTYVDYRGKTPPKTDSGIFLVTAKNISNGKINYEYSQEYIPEELYNSVMSRGKPKLGDVLITTEAPLGEIAQIDKENIALAQRIIKYRGNDGLLNDYLKYAFLSKYFQSELQKESTGSTVKGIKGSRLHKLEIPLPPLPEQQKIAEILTTIDDKLENIENKISQYTQLKKGLMQQLLTKGIGHTEFVDSPLGMIPKEWKVLNAEDFCKVEYGISEAVSQNTDSHIGIPILTGANITLNGKLDLTKKVYIPKRKEERFIVRKGDILFNWRSGSPNHVGKTVIFNLDDEYTYASFILKFRTNEDMMYNLFFNFQIQYLKEKEYFTKDTSIQVNFKINATVFRTIKFFLPPLPEQQQIANILTSVDDKLELLQNQKGEYTSLKKGLMEQLLTGKVRVKV